MIRTLLAATALTIIAQPAFAQSAEQDFVELREEVWEWTLDNSPGLGTSVGHRRGDGRLGDNALAASDREWLVTVVDQHDLHLAAIIGIDGARAIEHRDAVSCRKA